jgi:filamentous hemagglutinin family protein
MSHRQPATPSALRLKPLAAAVRTALAGTVLCGTQARAAELPVPQATFVTSGQASQAVSGSTLTINQFSDRAVLNWKSFNVGADAAVQFKQPGAASIALNRIFQNDPSRILGKLTANGQVYLLNQNGFVFGKGSQVDVNTLVVSTLDIGDDTFQRGITKVLDQDGRAALVGKGEVYRRDADGNFVLDAQGNKVKIGIDFQQGSKVTVADQGRIIAAAPAVTNQGELSAPEGQILLVAASDKVYLQEAGADSGLRGLLVEVGSGGEVNNLGKLMAQHGNVTLMGFAVNQAGRVSATTSVKTNGSVRLLAREGGSTSREGSAFLLRAGTTKRAADQGDGLGTRATVRLGKGSSTAATPDLKDQSKAVDGQPQEASTVEVMGQQVRIERGAKLVSRSGKIAVTATENPQNPGQANVKNDSRVYVDPGAKIDVSGIRKVSLPMSRNVVEVELRSNELRDSPLQRDGVLYAKTVKVDIRQGTPIADISGGLERIVRTVAERSTAGGSISLAAEGEAILSRRSKLDFSGGSVFYRPGYINTTQLLLNDGKTVDIGVADPNQQYAGILGKVVEEFPTWNLTVSHDRVGPQNQGRYQPGYVDGKAAGSLDIKAAALELEGEMRGIALHGVRQREPSLQPAGGSLSIDLARSPDSTQAVVFRADPPALGTGPDAAFPADPDAPGQPAALALSGRVLSRAGIQTARIATNGQVSIQAGETLTVPGGGSLSLAGGEIAVEGAISAPSGQVDLTTKLTGATLGQLSGAIALGPEARIDASGGWINDRPAQSTGDNRLSRGRILADGGSVSLTAQGDVALASGSLIDVSGGGRRTLGNDVEAGNAGAIAVKAAAIDGSDIHLDGGLRGYALSGGQGGSLSLTSDQVVLGDSVPTVDQSQGASPQPEEGPVPLLLKPGFFAEGGFAQYSVASNKGGVVVADGAQIKVSVQNRLLKPGYVSRQSGADLAQFSRIDLLPEISRPAGSLSLSLAQQAGQGAAGTAVVVGQGARLATDPGGKLALTSDTSILVNGALDAPAGTIDLTVTPPVGADPGFLPAQGIRLGAGASLSATGRALTTQDGLGRVTGEVLPGGNISILANRGFVVAEAGSTVDVSGTAARLDLPTPGPNGAVATASRVVPSAGGSIAVQSAEGIQLYGDLRGQPGQGPGAEGGSLALELNPLTRNEPDQIVPGQLPFPKVTDVIAVSQSPGTGSPPEAGAAVPASQYGLALLDADRVGQGGFASLSLRTPGRIEFQGAVALKTERSLALDAPALAFKPAPDAAPDAAAAVSLNSAYVALGSTQARPGSVAPASGQASLEVQGGTVDLVGEGVLQGFAGASIASAGDIRLIGVRTNQQQRDFLGEFVSPGDLSLKADQIYPATLSDFRLAVQGQAGATLSVLPGDSPAGAVLSAGGKLTLDAPNIMQGGVVKAPLGELDFKATDKLVLAAGSVTSNSAAGGVIPFGRTQGGLDWVYPLGEQNLVFDAPPAKSLSLQGGVVQLDSGAVLDTSGGGDLFAFEFVPGPGGSNDLLDPASPAYKTTFAVLPGFTGATAPYDPLETPGSGLKVGDGVHLAGGGGLKAGDYVLLPAHYALLPGAFLVTPVPGFTDLVPGQKLVDGNGTPKGAPIVAGYREVAGTAIRDARWSGFTVEPGSAARLRAQYDGFRANTFYVDQAKDKEQPVPYLPNDAGAMLIAAQTGLSLDGHVEAAPAEGGQGGRLDIEATDIAIVSQAQADQPAAPGAVKLVAEQLNSLGVASIAIGGARSAGDGYTGIAVNAATLRLGQDAQLSGAEFILAAKDSISFANGSGVAAVGAASDSATPTVYQLDGDAAFVRVSNAGQADLQRSGATGASGAIDIGQGAKISAPGSMIVDATSQLTLAGSLETQGGAVALGANRISLGDAAQGQDGLVLTTALLGSLDTEQLTLRSGSDIGLYGGVNLTAKKLTLDSGALLGYANAGQTAALQVDDLRLQNSAGAASDRQGDGTGTLAVSAQTVEFGEGSYRLQGFSSAGFEASGAISGEGTGSLAAAADLNLKAAVFTGGKGADTTLDASGHQVSLQSSGSPTTPTALGARLTVVADRIQQGGAIALPSGVAKLQALTGDVQLTAGSSIDVSGQNVAIGSATLATDGGAIQLTADAGNVALDAGASLKLTGQRGGTLSVAAPQGGFQFGGTADAHGVAQGGGFALDAGTLGDGGALGPLTAQLAASGFTDAIQLRTRTGDLNLAAQNSIAARSIQLTADQGNLNIAGALRTTGADAQVKLSAQDGLRLASSAVIQARGTPDQGGSATLEAVDGQGIVVESGAKIDLAAQGGSANGMLSLRAARTGDEVAVTGNIGQAVSGAKQATVEAVRTYSLGGAIGANDIANWKADTDSYMVNASAIETRLNLPGGLRPGLEIHSSGNLVLGSGGWDLVDWRYDGRPGVLTLKADANLTVNGPLSDGFKDEAAGIDLSALLGPGRTIPVEDLLQPGQSWSYRLEAGGDVTLGAGAVVRTGTGDIQVNAGQDFVLSDAASALYTAGRPADGPRYGSFKNGYVAFQFYGEYPVDGGDIAVSAGRDVIGARSGQFFDGWMVRTGNWTQNADHTGETPAAWAIAIGGPVGTGQTAGSFQQNIGALGGGDVTVRAGRDVTNLSVVIPTTGKQVGQVAQPDDPSDPGFLTNQVEVGGGGNLKLTAGGDVTGGTFYTGRGSADIAAAGSIKGSSAANGLGPVLALGDSRFDLQAGGDIVLGAAINPTVINNAKGGAFFFTYSAGSGVHLQALSGDVELQNDTGGVIDAANSLRPANRQLNFTGSSASALNVYPAALDLAAPQGNIVLDRSFITYPAATGAFSLLAGGDITTGDLGQNVNATLSDADPALLPSVALPASNWEDATQRLQPFGAPNLIHAQTPVHTGDPAPARFYAGGSLYSNDPLLFSLAKPMDVQAGKDLVDVSFDTQHPSYALSSVQVGRDIRYTSPRNAQGNLVNLTREMQLAGPGQLWVEAGRNIDLGASEGVYTVGNLNNPSLPAGGASITLLAGMGDVAHFDAFAQAYDPLSAQYAAQLTAYMRQRTGNGELDAQAAAAAYQALPEDQRREFLLAVFFDQLRDAATLAARTGKPSAYDGGYKAIEALFPGSGGKDSKYQGDLKLFFSKVHTVDGGDINLLVPGGLVNAGLAVAFAGSKAASDLGIVAERDGAVNAFLDGNFLVNQSRVFALNGGDITIWSSHGNIDAGRGAKAALAVPPPIVTFDQFGNLQVVFPPVVSGSGIRTAASTAPFPGDVFLAAPRGVVNAGEAGIGARNVTIAATAVIGASNISVSGTATGVPSANVAVPIAPAGVANAAASAAQTAQQTTQASGDDDEQAEKRKQLAESARLTPLTVEVLGFGECSVADVRSGAAGCG